MNEININGKIYVPKGTEKKQIQLVKLDKKKTYCIIRTYSAGVFAGWYDRNTKGREGTIFNSRRIFYWSGANSLSQLAMDGITNPSNCKFVKIVPETDLKEIIEIIPITEKAKISIESVSIWEK